MYSLPASNKTRLNGCFIIIFGCIMSFWRPVISSFSVFKSTLAAAAVVFFFSYWFYMVLTTWVSPLISLLQHYYQQRQNHLLLIHANYENLETGNRQSLLQMLWAQFSWGLAFRQLLTAVCGVDLVVFTIMSKYI